MKSNGQKKQGKIDVLGVTERSVIGLNNCSVSVVYKDPNNKSCECRESHRQNCEFHSQGVVYWLVLCVSLTQAGVITEKGASLEEVPP